MTFEVRALSVCTWMGSVKSGSISGGFQSSLDDCDRAFNVTRASSVQ